MVHAAAEERAVVSSRGASEGKEVLQLGVVVDLLQDLGGKVGDGHDCDCFCICILVILFCDLIA